MLKITNPAFFTSPLSSSRLSFLEKENERLQNEVYEFQRKLVSEGKKPIKKFQENSDIVVVEENTLAASSDSILLQLKPKSDDSVDKEEKVVGVEKTFDLILNKVADVKKKPEIQSVDLEKLKEKEKALEREAQRLDERVLEIDNLLMSLSDMNTILSGCVLDRVIEDGSVSNNFKGVENQNNHNNNNNNDNSIYNSHFSLWKKLSPWRFFCRQQPQNSPQLKLKTKN